MRKTGCRTSRKSRKRLPGQGCVGREASGARQQSPWGAELLYWPEAGAICRDGLAAKGCGRPAAVLPGKAGKGLSGQKCVGREENGSLQKRPWERNCFSDPWPAQFPKVNMEAKGCGSDSGLFLSKAGDGRVCRMWQKEVLKCDVRRILRCLLPQWTLHWHGTVAIYRRTRDGESWRGFLIFAERKSTAERGAEERPAGKRTMEGRRLNILAVDTSGPVAGCAIMRGETIVYTRHCAWA